MCIPVIILNAFSLSIAYLICIQCKCIQKTIQQHSTHLSIVSDLRTIFIFEKPTSSLYTHTYIQNNNAFYPTRSTMSQTVLPFHLMINRWTSSRPDDLSHSTTHMSFCIERLPFPTRSFLLLYCIAKKNKQGVSWQSGLDFDPTCLRAKYCLDNKIQLFISSKQYF